MIDDILIDYYSTNPILKNYVAYYPPTHILINKEYYNFISDVCELLGSHFFQNMVRKVKGFNITQILNNILNNEECKILTIAKNIKPDINDILVADKIVEDVSYLEFNIIFSDDHDLVLCILKETESYNHEQLVRIVHDAYDKGFFLTKWNCFRLSKLGKISHSSLAFINDFENIPSDEDNVKRINILQHY